jgi:hypothetical protein
MILAFLRGLLKPGYPNGVRSMQGESLMLAALEREMLARDGMEWLMLESSFTTLLKSPGEYRNSMRDRADRLQRLRDGNPEDPRQQSFDLAKTYKFLEKSGYLAQIAERDMNLEEQLMQKHPQS